MHELHESPTWEIIQPFGGGNYDAAFFDKAYLQKRIDNAMTGKPANYSGMLHEGGAGFSYDGEVQSRVEALPISASRSTVRCASCEKVLKNAQWCSACQSVAYCDRECQKAHWKAGHKLACFKTNKKEQS